jgi:exodeoxyribonuclease VII large subunit
LPRALRANAQLHHTQFSRVAGRLAPQLLRREVERRRERFNAATSAATALKVYRDRGFAIARQRDRVKAGAAPPRARNLIANRSAAPRRRSVAGGAVLSRRAVARLCARRDDWPSAARGRGRSPAWLTSSSPTAVGASDGAGGKQRTRAAVHKPASKPRKPAAARGSLFG